MKELFIALFALSSVDSLNPIGITQQFILQGMVKKPRHIWYFILTTGVVNMIFGYLVYYGVMALINRYLDVVLTEYGAIVYSVEIALGLAVLAFAVKSLLSYLRTKRRGREESVSESEREIQSRIRSVTPLALIAIGVISTASELTSAVPYFAFLAVLVKYELPFLLLTLIFILYNMIYILPFVLLFLVYILSKKTFERVYSFFRTRFRAVLEVALPLLFFALAAFVLYDGGANLINYLQM